MVTSRGSWRDEEDDGIISSKVCRLESVPAEAHLDVKVPARNLAVYLILGKVIGVISDRRENNVKVLDSIIIPLH